MNRKNAAAAIVLTCAFLAACAARPTSLTVPLIYQPTNTFSDSITLPPGQGKICIIGIDDQRTEKDKIGQNLEDPNQIVKIVSDVPTAPDWVHDTMADIFRHNGLNIVTNPDDADVLLSIKLTNFWVEEASEYVARITAIVKVQDKNGTVLFTGSINGQDEMTGRGLKPENYQQVLSNSMYSAVNRLLNNDAFQKSLVISPAAK